MPSDLIVSGWAKETEIVSVSLIKIWTCLAKKQNLQTDQSNIYFLRKTMCLLGDESMLIEFLITTNEIWDISISFLNDHLDKTLGPIEIEENCWTSGLRYLKKGGLN